jgi:hypothetical protein
MNKSPAFSSKNHAGARRKGSLPASAATPPLFFTGATGSDANSSAIVLLLFLVLVLSFREFPRKRTRTRTRTIFNGVTSLPVTPVLH